MQNLSLEPYKNIAKEFFDFLSKNKCLSDNLNVAEFNDVCEKTIDSLLTITTTLVQFIVTVGLLFTVSYTCGQYVAINYGINHSCYFIVAVITGSIISVIFGMNLLLNFISQSIFRIKVCTYTFIVLSSYASGIITGSILKWLIEQ
jgi:ABC-type uncharacterized transport system fused permease/ATPase subunit